MTTIRLKNKHAANFSALIGLYSKDALASPLRSTVPLLDYWRNTDQRLAEIAKVTGADLGSDSDLCFEREVPVQAGVGAPSCTDLMICSASAALAIEAKFTEPRYEIVRDWLGNPQKENRVEVLNGWLSLISRHTSARLDADVVADLPYQLVHRTASVCAMTPQQRWVIYQIFGNSPVGEYIDDLFTLSRKLGPTSALKFAVLACPVTGLATHGALQQRWMNGERSMGNDVRAALLAGPLFAFGSPHTVHVVAHAIS